MWCVVDRPEQGFRRSNAGFGDERTQLLYRELLHGLPLCSGDPFETTREIIRNFNGQIRLAPPLSYCGSRSESNQFSVGVGEDLC